MEKIEIINKVNELLKKYEINDAEIKEDIPALLLKVEKEDNIPSYKIAIQPLDDGSINIYTAFSHGLTETKQSRRLLGLCNDFNNQSFLKFVVTKKFIKVSHMIPEFMNDIEYIVRVVTVIPNLISEFYDDLLARVNKIRG